MSGCLGKPSVLLIHGAGSSARSWRRVVARLSSIGWAIEAVDMPGHGAHWSVTPKSVRHIADLVVEGLKADHYDIVAGHSMGAAVVCELGRRRPEIASHLILEEPPGGHDSISFPAVADQLLELSARAQSDPRAALRDLLRGWPRHESGDVVQALADVALCNAKPIAELLRSGSVAVSPIDIADLPVSTTVLVSSHGADTRRDGSADTTSFGLKDRVSLGEHEHVKIVEFETGHCIHREAPGEWISALDSVLYDVTPRWIGQ